MRIRLLLTVLLLSRVLEAHALQLIDVVDGQTVTIKVSMNDLTRIAMADGGRIQRVWGLDDRMQVQPDPDGGQVFLRPAIDVGTRAFSFFIRDDHGATHTVLAVPVDMPSDTVLLRPKNRDPDVTRHDARSLPYIDRIKHLVRDMARNAVPDGYLPATEEREIPLWAEAKVMLVMRYRGDFTGEVYRVTNVSDDAMRLDERELSRLATDIKAVAIMEHELASQQSTSIYLVREGR